MANFFEVLGSETKALVRKVSFAPAGGATNYGGYYGNSGAPISLLHRGDFGAGPLDLGALVGDPLSNSVVAACVAAVAKAIPDAPPLLERRVVSDDGEQWERVTDHPLLQLLNRPNGYQSSADVRGLTVAQEMTRGEAFWYLAFDGTVPREIWVWPTEKVMVESSESQPISGYMLTGETGQPIRVGNHEIIHFRYLPSVYNWRRGWTPLVTGARQIAGDSAAATYHSAILSNAGVLSLLISLKDSSAAGEVTPGQLQEYLDQLKRKLSGNGAGAMAGLDLPLDVHKIGYSPDEMALDKLINYYESRICALMGVDPMVCGLGSGTMQKTYANLGEALNDFWERQIVPMLRRHASTLTAQLFPSFGMEASEWRLSFDTSEVAALQENVDALFTRWRELWQAGGIDLYTLQTKIGLPQVPQEYRGRFAGDKAKDETDSSEGAKSFWDGVKYDPHQPREADGRWGSGGSRAIAELGDRARGGLPEAGYVLNADTGELVDYAEATNENPHELELDKGKYGHLPKVHMLHSHPYESPPSPTDWQTFLNEDNVSRLTTVTPRNIYVMEKTGGELKAKYPVKIAEFIMLGHVEMIKQRSPYKGMPNPQIPEAEYVKIWDEANLKMAEDYGIKIHKKGVP